MLVITKRCLGALGIIAIIVMVTLMTNRHYLPMSVRPLSAIVNMTRSIQLDSSPKEKTILFWTLWYQRKWFPGGYGPEILATCPVRCRLTTDRSLFNSSDAIMFHTHYNDFNETDLPVHRLPHQRFIMYFFEPLIYTSREAFNRAPAHFFNWTFTFRRFSDIFGTQYGSYELIPDSMERKRKEYSNQEETLDDYYGVNITAKSIMVAWFVSYCDTLISRENYVDELSKYVQVDIYGQCGNLDCPREAANEHGSCEQLLRKKYLFYLSFENSFCPDYVTEKLYWPLLAGAVPIVFGAGHYSRYAPPHSYINALEYESPKQLAKYLIQLERNRRLYAHYFEWRRHFRIISDPVDSWCTLCHMLHDDSLPPKSYESITRWWIDDNPCFEYQWTPNSTSSSTW